MARTDCIGGKPAAVTQDAIDGILSDSLDFHDQASNYALHSVHGFAAKFPPQLPRAFIEALTDPGETVLDPMVGSGTTAVEALLLGRNALGFDLDPLARLVSRAKTAALRPEAVEDVARKVVDAAQLALWRVRDLDERLRATYSPEVLDFFDYWFRPDTQRELMALKIALDELAPGPTARFLQMLFSSIIITKSGGVSMSRDLAHTRPWRDRDKQPKSAIEQFHRKATGVIASLHPPLHDGCRAWICGADARRLPVRAKAVHLIVTSPPYANNAIDYMRAHKFSLTWLGYSLSDLRELRRQYIGSELAPQSNRIALPEDAREAIARVGQRDSKRASFVEKYLCEMRDSLREMLRVLVPGRAAIVVVGPSSIREVQVQTQDYLAQIGGQIGFRVLGVKERQLDRDRRLMPASASEEGTTGIERRLHREFIIAFQKPEEPHEHRAAVTVVCGGDGRLEQMLDLTELIEATYDW